MARPTIYTARHIFPVTADPIASGGLAVVDGRILALGPADTLIARYPGARRVDLGEAALFPAAVNAHTHLELTGLAGALPHDLDLASWIVALIRARGQLSFDDFTRAATDGVAMLRDSGIAAVGEICTAGASARPIVESGLRGIVYYELLSGDPTRAEETVARGQRQLQRWHEEYPGASVRFGLSLHAPYTVSAPLFRLASAWCRDEGVPLCIHAAESPAETQWLRDRTGPIADTLYASLGIPTDGEPAPGRSPIAYLDDLGVLRARPLLVHGVHVDGDDLARMARAACAVAHCPRSNTRLLCGRMPYEAYRRAGVHLALGTDSLASSDSLSVWEEAAAAWSLHDAAQDGDVARPRDWLRLATLAGAEALGVERDLGSLEEGKHAALAAASLASLSERERMDADLVLLALLEGRLAVRAVKD